LAQEEHVKKWLILSAAMISLATAQEQPDTSSQVAADSGAAKADTAKAVVSVPDPAVKPAPAIEPAAEEQPKTENSTATVDKTVLFPKVERQEKVVHDIVFPQDPKICAFLSITFPGLGQLYQGNYWKTAAFTGSFLLGSITIAHLASENRERSAETVRFEDTDGNIRELTTYDDPGWSDSHLDDGEKFVSVCAFAVVATSYIWSVIDAYRSAKAFNRKNFIPSGEKTHKTSLSPIIGNGTVGVAAVRSF
jgi:hypothetical protein